ncbi:MAG: flagellar hook capping FlgD N-terminal domain-containing protein [Bacteroidota bacterium]
MTPVSSASTASGFIGQASLSASGSGDLDRDAFLQLLVAQLRNQDPTSPQDGHEFAAQLAQFSSVEQLTQLNASVQGQSGEFAAIGQALGALGAGQDALGERLSSQINLQAASGLIGQTVAVRDRAVAYDGEGAAPVQVRLGGAAREVEVTIRNEAGEVVRTLRASDLGAGDHAIAWDGADMDGAPAPAGAYTVDVSAVGATGAPVEAAPMSTGRVDRITVDGDGLALWVGGRAIPFDALLAIEAGS